MGIRSDIENMKIGDRFSVINRGVRDEFFLDKIDKRDMTGKYLSSPHCSSLSYEFFSVDDLINGAFIYIGAPIIKKDTLPITFMNRLKLQKPTVTESFTVTGKFLRSRYEFDSGLKESVKKEDSSFTNHKDFAENQIHYSGGYNVCMESYMDTLYSNDVKEALRKAFGG